MEFNIIAPLASSGPIRQYTGSGDDQSITYSVDDHANRSKTAV